MEFTLEEILEATDAKVLKNEGVNDLRFTFSTDTRTIENGQIYLPLKGGSFDGEKFIDKAITAGAIGYFCTLGQVADGAKLVLQVDSALTAYLQLALFYRRKINPITIAITGSSGKTTTKEMAYCVAKEGFRTHKSELNFNNEVGLCKTILSMPEDTEVLILEMGMRGLGEIELLSKYSEPNLAIIANVGTAHIGRLGSKENIAVAKCEIVKHLKSGGTLIAHNDELIKKQMFLSSNQKNILFDLNEARIIKREIGYSKFEYKEFLYELNIEGDYNIQNALSVIEIGLLLNLDRANIAQGLLNYSPIEKRWETQEVKGYKIINDSYNANPESMKGTIKTVFELYKDSVVLVLGDMGELGEDESFYHKQIGDFLAQELNKNSFLLENVNIVTIGKLSNEITRVLSAHGFESKHFEDNLQTTRYILENVEIGTTIILKASRSMKLEEIIEGIKKS